MDVMEWKWYGNEMDEILDVGSSTHVVFDCIWFWKALDVGSSVFLFFKKNSFYLIY